MGSFFMPATEKYSESYFFDKILARKTNMARPKATTSIFKKWKPTIFEQQDSEFLYINFIIFPPNHGCMHLRE